MNRIGRRTILAILLIAALAIIRNVLGHWTLCIFDAVSQARQIAYNVVALETGQPKSPSGANEQH